MNLNRNPDIAIKENLVSIITPMYKSALYIGKTVESVMKQTYAHWEMIIVDDCSPDDGASISIVRKYQDSDNRIKLIQLKENRGSSGARNEAMRNACGRFLAFLDSDDIWDDKFLEIMLNHIHESRQDNAAIYFSGYRRMNSVCSHEVLLPYIYTHIIDFRKLLLLCPILPSATILDTTKLREKVFFREELRSLRDDYVFWLDIMKQGLVAIGYSDVIVSYRMRDDSITASKREIIKPQFKVYYNILGMNIFKCLFYLCLWCINGMKKYRRMKHITSLLRSSS